MWFFRMAISFSAPAGLQASLELFETFPNVGMVTARPYRGIPEIFHRHIRMGAQARHRCARRRHDSWIGRLSGNTGAASGYLKSKHVKIIPKGRDYRLTYQGKTAYIGASHFQFMTRRDLLKKIIPLPSEQPMRGERALDIAINEMGYLRLTTEKRLVYAYGKPSAGFSSSWQPIPKHRDPCSSGCSGCRVSAMFLLWLNNQIFRLYFFNVE